MDDPKTPQFFIDQLEGLPTDKRLLKADNMLLEAEMFVCPLRTNALFRVAHTLDFPPEEKFWRLLVLLRAKLDAAGNSGPRTAERDEMIFIENEVAKKDGDGYEARIAALAEEYGMTLDAVIKAINRRNKAPEIE